MAADGETAGRLAAQESVLGNHPRRDVLEADRDLQALLTQRRREAKGTDERASCEILGVTRLFADEHQLGGARAFAEHRLRAALPELARLAVRGSVPHAGDRGMVRD